KIDSQDVKSKVVCAKCKKCLNFVNHEVCLNNYVNDNKSHGNLKLLINFYWKFMGTVRFGNDHVTAILGFGDLQWGNILITRVYFVEGLGHNLFSVGQFCDSDLEVAFQRNVCFVRNLEGVDLLKGLLKFKYHKEHLCPLCEQGKSKIASHPPKPVPNSRQRLHLLHMDLCRPMRIASINGKRYILVIVDDYSRYTWVHFLRSKDKAPAVIITFLKRITVLFQSPVIIIRTDNGTEFKNQVLKVYFDYVGISHLMSSVRTPQQNRLVERRNRTLVEAARTMFIFSPMYDDYFGGQVLATVENVLPAQEPQVRQTSTASTTIADNVPIPTNSSSHATNISITSQDVDELNPNAMVDGNTFVNPFATSSSNAAETSSSQNNVKEAMTDPAWIASMQEELLQFKRIDVWVLVPTPDNISPLTLKWIFKNKHDEEQTVIRNKSRLVKGSIDPTLFIRRFHDDILVVQVYVDDIIFGSTHPRYSQLFSDLMKGRYEMSMMREMTFFLGLQVNQSPCGIFINQSKYVLEILKKYGMESCDPVGTPMEIKDKLDLDQNGTLVDATKYRSMIGALMYLTSSRPDIVHATCLCAQYQAKPNEKHLKEDAFYDDDDDDDVDYTIAITPILSTEEPDNSLSMRDEHLDTILATESDEVLKSSVENLIPILSESEGIPEHMCDVPFHDNSLPLDVSKNQFKDFFESNDEFSSTDDDSFSIDNIDYVEASPPDSELVSSKVMEIVIPEVGGIDDDILLTIKDDILHEKLLNVNLLIAKIKALNDNPTSSSDCKTKSPSTSLNSLFEETNTFDNSLPEFETFCFDVEEISSGRTITHSDNSLPEYEVFHDDHVKEISSGSPTTHSDSSLYASSLFDLSINPFPPADRSDFYEFTDELIPFISPLEYDCFLFKVEPNSRDFTKDIVEDISPTKEPQVHNALPTHPNSCSVFFLFSNKCNLRRLASSNLVFVMIGRIPQIIKTHVLVVLSNAHSVFIHWHATLGIIYP
nr:copia protein [Tanacetum cinerariifolium]